MATQLTPSGVYKPEKYPQGSVGTYYQHYGEQPGYVYLPWKDRYVPDPKAQQQYLEESGLKEKDKKGPSTAGQLGTIAGGAVATAAGTYLGKKGLDSFSKVWSKPSVKAGGAAPAPAVGGGTNVGLLSGAPTSPMGTNNVGSTVGETAGLQGQYNLDGEFVLNQPESGAAPQQGGTKIDPGTNYGAYAQGLSGAGQLYGAYDAYKDKEYVGAGLNAASGAANLGAGYIGATQGAGAASQSTAGQALPYLNTALTGYNVLKARNTDNVDARTRAAMAGHEAGVGVANYFTFGLAGLADAGIKKWAPSWYENHIERHAKYDPVTKQFGRWISGKDKYQFLRDQGRKYMKEAGIIDDQYQGTLADGSKFDFGQDGSKLKLDYKDPVTGEVIAKADLLAVAEGLTGKARESMAMLYTNAALSNAKGDKAKAYDNIAHFMRQRQINLQDVNKTLDQQLKDDQISKEDYEVYKATASSFIPEKIGDSNVGLLAGAKPNQGSPGMRPGKTWNGNKYTDNKKPQQKKTDQVFNKATQQPVGAI